MNRDDFLTLCNKYDSSKHILCYSEDKRECANQDPLKHSDWSFTTYYLKDRNCPHIISFLEGKDLVSWTACDCKQCANERKRSDPIAHLWDHIETKTIEIDKYKTELTRLKKVVK